MKKGLFSKVLVIYCIIFVSLSIIAAMVIQFMTGEDTSSIVQIAAMVFGGELLMLLVKRIFAKPTQSGDEFNERNDESDEGC